MKKLIFCSVLFALLSCTKQAVKTVEKDGTDVLLSQLSGRWNLESDSFNTGVALNNHLVTYAGKSGDYFDFRTDGYVYTKEDSALDTLSYNVVSDSTIIIESFGFSGDTSKVFISDNTAVITSPTDNTPGGVFGRTVHLIKTN